MEPPPPVERQSCLTSFKTPKITIKHNFSFSSLMLRTWASQRKWENEISFIRFLPFGNGWWANKINNCFQCHIVLRCVRKWQKLAHFKCSQGIAWLSLFLCKAIALLLIHYGVFFIMLIYKHFTFSSDLTPTDGKIALLVTSVRSLSWRDLNGCPKWKEISCTFKNKELVWKHPQQAGRLWHITPLHCNKNV